MADVYTGSPIIIVYIFSILPKISILVFFFRVFSFIIYPTLMLTTDFSYIFLNFFIGCSVFSIFIGSLGAVIRQHLRNF